MYIISNVPAPVSRTIYDEKTRKKVEVLFDFSLKNAYEIPEVALEWAKSLEHTQPERYEIVEKKPEVIEAEIFTAPQLLAMQDEEFFDTIKKYRLPGDIRTKRTIVAHLLDLGLIKETGTIKKQEDKVDENNFTLDELESLDDETFWSIAREAGLSATITKRETATKKLLEG